VLLRRKLTVLVMAVMMLVMSAAPALAGDKPKRAQPTSPPGYTNGQQSEEAAFPQTGRNNRFDHGCPQANNCP
jgi:hypothetical protein